MPLEISIEYFDNLGASETITIVYTPNVPASGASNIWTMQVIDNASGSTPVAEFALEFDGTRGSGGTLLSVTPVSGGTYNAAAGAVGINVAGGPMTIEIGEPGSTSHLTQLSAEFAPVAISKNGTPVGNLSGIQINENGFLEAVFDTGLTRVIYQIPVADVPNPNGLAALDGQAFRVTPDSGDFYLWDAGDGPTGETIGFAREESTTDIAGELTQLIQTQRAYSSNAKIIQTVDEMFLKATDVKTACASVKILRRKIKRLGHVGEPSAFAFHVDRPGPRLKSTAGISTGFCPCQSAQNVDWNTDA